LPRASPSPTRLKNVIAAIKDSGLHVRAVAVQADGSFTVSVDDKAQDAAPSPKQWGKAG
jgi:hypothetical protein